MSRPAALLPLALLLAPSRGTAQVSRLSDLSFGTVVAGTSASVTPESASGASWRIHYSLAAIASSFKLTLPGTLTRAGGGSMPVTFCSTCGLYRLNNSNPSGATTFDPASTVSLGLIALGGNVYIWLGGSIAPPASQTPGSYSGTVVLTLSGVTL